ncbi:MAG: TadE/TadG family type IV pilus assembly protein [Anaerolineaceae bacterium]
MRKKNRGQSLLEFAILVPVLVLFVLGAAEITLFIGTYIDVIDLTRESARFASVRDPFLSYSGTNCSADYTKPTPDPNNSFFYDTACIFSPLKASDSCSTADPTFCNGFNSTIFFKSNEDDIVINVFTVTNDHVTLQTGPWAWSTSRDSTHTVNWQRNCDGSPIVPTPSPYFTIAKMNAYLAETSGTVPNKGFVTVEAYYCYHQVMKVPLIGLLFPDPMRIHVYTIMPLPAAAPADTPYPTDTPTGP